MRWRRPHRGIRWCAALDPRAASEVLLPLLTAVTAAAQRAHGGRGGPAAGVGAVRPISTVEGQLDPAFLTSVAATGKTLISPMLGQAGDSVARDRARLPDRRRQHRRRRARLVGASRSAGARAGVDSDAARLGRHADGREQRSSSRAASMRAQYVGRPATPTGQARNPFEVPASAILTGVDGVERVFGNGVVERGPWLASVGIPTVGGDGAQPADLPAQLRHRHRRDGGHHRVDWS